MVHPMASKIVTERFWRGTLQHRMNRRSTEERRSMCRMNDVSRATTAIRRRGREPDESMALKSKQWFIQRYTF
jgi:hypothetical protein